LPSASHDASPVAAKGRRRTAAAEQLSTPAAASPARRQRLRHQLDVLLVLARSDMRIRYGRGSFRVLKWLLDPFAALGVYLILIGLVLDRGETAAGLSLACAIVPFQLIITTMSNALQTVNLRSSIIVNMSFPRMLIPVSCVVTEAVAFTATLSMLPLMMLIYGVGPTASVLWLPVGLVLTALFALALAYPSALFGIWYPEMMPFAVSIVRTMFFLAPGLIALDQITGVAHDTLPINPLSGLFELFRDALLYGRAPAAWELLVPLGAALLLLAVMIPVFRREQAQLAKLVG
jgi:ABC-type polysaccharide/polyol phosphate export permease